MKKKMSPRKFGSIFISITAVLLVAAIVVTCVMNYWSTVMDAVFGSAKINIQAAKGTESWDTDYYKLTTGGYTRESVAEAGKLLARRAEAEGIVLLKNSDHALPLNVGGGMEINALGWSFYYPSLGGSGSGAVGSTDLVSPTEAFAAANITVNKGIADYYYDWSNKHYTDWQITKANGYYTDDDTNKAPQRPTVGKTYDAAWDVPELNAQEIEEAVNGSSAENNPVQVLWLGRGGGEYHDLPTVMTKEGGRMLTKIGKTKRLPRNPMFRPGKKRKPMLNRRKIRKAHLNPMILLTMKARKNPMSLMILMERRKKAWNLPRMNPGLKHLNSRNLIQYRTPISLWTIWC